MEDYSIDELLQLGREHIWLPHTQLEDLEDPHSLSLAVTGNGCYIIDHDGKRYLDASALSHCCVVGHGRKEIADAVYKQMLNLEFAGSGMIPFSTSPTIMLAARLAELSPGNLSRVFFTTSGTEAVEAALKMARQYHAQNGSPNKYKVLFRNYAFHGFTWGAMSVSGDPVIRSPMFEPMNPMGVMIPEGNPSRCQYCSGPCNLGCARAIEAVIEYEDPDSIAAVIVEPIAKGAVVSPPEYWQDLQLLCKENDILLIVDEVVTAFGRTGTWFGCAHSGLEPDIMVLGKTLGGGYLPIGAVVASTEVAERFFGGREKNFSHSPTLAAHPACTTAALTNLEIIGRENLVQRSATMGVHFRGRLDTLLDHSSVTEVRSIGLLGAVELGVNGDIHTPFGLTAGKRMSKFMLDSGLFLVTRGSSFSIHPPLTITEEEIDQMVHILDRTLTFAEEELT